MKKKLMTLQQHRLLKEAGQLIAFSERLKHAQKETTDRNIPAYLLFFPVIDR